MSGYYPGLQMELFSFKFTEPSAQFIPQWEPN